MPPWNQMSPQQQLQMMMSRGTAGMQFPGAAGTNAPGMQFPGAGPPNPQLPMAGMPGAITPLQTAPGFNPLANQAQQMNPAMLQYLLGMQNQGGGMPGMQQPTLAQLLQMRGTGLGL